MMSNPKERALHAIPAGGKGKRGKMGKAISMAQLASVVAAGVFLAGVVAPTVLQAMTPLAIVRLALLSIR